MKRYALIVAGGSGSRMGGTVPKQFLPLGGRPVLMHTLDCFRAYAPALPVTLVLPAADLDRWEALRAEYDYPPTPALVAGGPTRFDSVRNGLNALPDEDALVAVHDGVRPFADRRVIDETFRAAERFGTGVAAVPLKDSLRRLGPEGTHAVDRARFRLVQTPQTFRLSDLREAYAAADGDATFTDDASVAEAFGLNIRLTEGSYRNLKITTPEDLPLAEALLSELRKEEAARPE